MEIVNKIMNYISKNNDEEPRRYIGASSIGKSCARSIWYNFKAYDADSTDPTLSLTFQIGKELENMILSYLMQSGIRAICLGRFFQDFKVHEFQGHVDGIIVLSPDERAILEIKSAKDSSFNKFVKHGLQAWQPAYYAQIQSYMGMSGIHKGVLLAINKNTSVMHEEWVDFDEIYYEELRLKAEIISKSETPPPKISEDGSYYVCKQCNFRRICHYE